MAAMKTLGPVQYGVSQVIHGSVQAGAQVCLTVALNLNVRNT